MPALLAFDSSAAHCAAVLVRDDAIAETRFQAMERGQAEALMPILTDLLRGAGLGWNGIDAFGVGIGPGNFTGTRIAVAAARGLALATGRPALGISMFDILRHAEEEVPDPVLTCLPAPRGQVYAELRPGDGSTQTFTFDGDEPILPRDLPDGTVILGHRAEDLALRLGGTGRPRHIADLPRSLGREAMRRFGGGPPFSRPAPLYARAADAAPPREMPPPIVP
ncbi:tRNA threonylcarbamoyl adenosine modification protein YeaZ [Palleronia aestuarii]|uniref:tRNA threonylcarbamoyl adenosine modification protein YeaZ n=1 Tax=Palleronia aestuarii TaxID=568105 RepID=A0A2W7P4P3_9RHOB|nr:tRNA (adenosine(37)-N6)-threonylcarbamoyltransferase complex dimerization subunit type 1 TsaB [Palleronia aestuarii]PZX18382.1 tRNA threonylcarbamoyl adenosine modification protein YeaZ [Palleronia aestuarii]